jgi:hypothetical protein
MADQTANEARLAADITKLTGSKDAIVSRVGAYKTQIADLLAELEKTKGEGLSEAATNAAFASLEAIITDMDAIGAVTPGSAPLKVPKFPAGL